MQFLLLLAASLLYAVGGLCMKYSNGLSRVGPSTLLYVLFLGGASCQALGMKRGEAGSLYVLVLGLEAVAAFALTSVFLGERITLQKAFATLVILAGIALLGRSA